MRWLPLTLLWLACDPDDAPATTESCARSAGCSVFGECGLTEDGTCGPTLEAHCRSAATACSAEGRCSLVDGRCVATAAADCLASTECRALGHCSVFDLGMCGAVTDDDCKSSDRCTLFHQCVAQVGECQNSGHGH